MAHGHSPPARDDSITTAQCASDRHTRSDLTWLSVMNLTIVCPERLGSQAADVGSLTHEK